MSNANELLKERQKVDDALNHLISQGELVEETERETLGQAYQDLWNVRTEMTKQLEGMVGEETLPAVQAPQVTGAPQRPAVRRQIRWGVLAVGGLGVAAIVGLIGWQLWKFHGKRSDRKKRHRR
jgi:ferric-dicitrate binding protein FerR (iron transport regulator)